jgi:hypothetical protein
MPVNFQKALVANTKAVFAELQTSREFLRSIGVPDLSPEEVVTERARRAVACREEVGASGLLARPSERIEQPSHDRRD